MASRRGSKITSRSQQKIYYTDFTRNFDLNPITNSLEKLVNAEDVKQSIENLVMTNPGERFYHLDVGSTVRQSLFGPLDAITVSKVHETINETINKYEKRAQNVVVEIIPDEVHNLYICNISFTVVNIPMVVQTMQVLLNRAR